MNTFIRFGATALLAAAPALATVGAQGYSFDVTSSGTDPRSGNAQVMGVSHGRWEKDLTRIDIIESPARGGMMGKGTYMIATRATGITTFVDPAKQQYYEFNSTEMAAAATELQGAMAGVAKMEAVDIHVDMEDLGAGETIEGYATWKYRLTQSYTMRMTILGHNNDTKQHTVSELWIAPALLGDLNPGSRPAASANGMLKELTETTYKAYAKLKPGAMLRMINTSTSGDGAKARNRVTTMNVSNFRRESFSASIFQVPAGYEKIDSPFEAFNAGKKP